MAEELGVVKRSVCTKEMDEDECMKVIKAAEPGFHVAVDCSGAEKARLLAMKGLNNKKWL